MEDRSSVRLSHGTTSNAEDSGMGNPRSTPFDGQLAQEPKPRESRLCQRCASLELFESSRYAYSQTPKFYIMDQPGEGYTMRTRDHIPREAEYHIGRNQVVESVCLHPLPTVHQASLCGFCYMILVLYKLLRTEESKKACCYITPLRADVSSGISAASVESWPTDLLISFCHVALDKQLFKASKTGQSWIIRAKSRLQRPHGDHRVSLKYEDWEPMLDDSSRLRFTICALSSDVGSHIFHQDLKTRFEQLRVWLRICKSEHKDSCLFPMEQVDRDERQNDNIVCLDVESFKLVPCTVRDRYLTVSYAWGQLPEDRKSMPLYRVGDIVDENMLPKTLSDVVQATKHLGERLLWVDCLCIDQQSEKEKITQIGRMHFIYARSFCTIVALAAKSAYHGIPCMRPTHSGVRRRMKGLDLVCVVDLNLPLSISTAVWSKRAWTFTEAMLSPRRIFLAEGDMFFFCMRCSGRASRRVFKDGTTSWSKMIDNKRGRRQRDYMPDPHLFSDIIKRLPYNFYVYTHLVEQYSDRDMTADVDRLRAIQPLFDRIQLAKEVKFVHGLWTRDGKGPELLRCLLWRASSPDKPLTRIKEYPSWTWAGWRGKVVYTVTDEPWDDKSLKVMKDFGYEPPTHGLDRMALARANEVRDWSFLDLDHLRRWSPILEQAEKSPTGVFMIQLVPKDMASVEVIYQANLRIRSDIRRMPEFEQRLTTVSRGKVKLLKEQTSSRSAHTVHSDQLFVMLARWRFHLPQLRYVSGEGEETLFGQDMIWALEVYEISDGTYERLNIYNIPEGLWTMGKRVKVKDGIVLM